MYIYTTSETQYNSVSIGMLQHPRRTSNVAKSEDNFESCEVSKTSEQSVDKRLYNMSAKFLFDTITLARPSMKLCVCKGNKSFLDMQLFFLFF